ncbi:tRNA (N6-threonylcarbamoyladenosine(37)-N6)-methyltransferase TrmO [bacterium]|nr:tRNA (N6-threonylcarbamoyladenosine(37)-N6)-methyltransferase TrmO [bacterium]
MSDLQFSFKPIGILKSCYPDKFGVPRQSGLVKKAYSELQISSEFQPEFSLEGLSGYSHVWLQFVFHLNSSTRFHAKVHPPRLDGESIGLFATRSPHRPNPIGLSLVELVEVKKDTLIFAGADLVDGTPILDVKPYLPHIESKPDARGGWALEVQKDEIQVEFSDSAMEILQNWIKKTGKSELKEVITDVLKQDPRPVIYKGYESQESPYRNKHAFRLYEGDIHFQFTSKNHVIVFDILL